jgi:hypothetical protein
MDDDSLNFGSPATAATPNSNSILAQPPLQGEDEHGTEQGDRPAKSTLAEGKFYTPIDVNIRT